MNKIVIDNNSNIEKIPIKKDTILKIDCNHIQKNIQIDVKDNVNLTIIDTSIYTKNDIVIDTSFNSNILINKMSVDTSDSVTININGENTNINFYNSIVNYNNNEYKETINHNVKNSNSKIVNHCVNVKDNTFKFIVDGKIGKNAIRTNFNQDNKIINISSGKSFILPNLIVDNNDIEASHSAYIGQFDEEIVFYLMTRGLSKEKTTKILIKAFLTNNIELNDNMKKHLEEMIKNIRKEELNE